MKRLGHQAAFTLVECLLALVVVSIVVTLVGLTLPAAYQASRQRLANPLDFQLMLAELEDRDHRFRLKGVNQHSLQLVDQQNKEFTLRSADRVYLTSNNGGYMELLDGIEVRSLVCQQLDSRRVLIAVTRKNGQRQWATVRFWAHEKRKPENKQAGSTTGLRLSPGTSRTSDHVSINNHQSPIFRDSTAGGISTQSPIH